MPSSAASSLSLSDDRNYPHVWVVVVVPFLLSSRIPFPASALNDVWTSQECGDEGVVMEIKEGRLDSVGTCTATIH